MLREAHPRTFVALAILFGFFVLFLYGPTITIAVLSFQGPDGGLMFPINGFSFHWFAEVFLPQSVGDIHGSFQRSLMLGLLVCITTVVLSFLAGLAFRRRFLGSGIVFYVVVASLIMPSIIVSLGIGSLFELLGLPRAWYSSGFGAHLTWTLPFGLLIMLSVFNRFDKRLDEAARDLGASGLQTVLYVIVPDHRARRSSASLSSASPSPMTSSPAARSRWAPSTPCPSSCRRCRPTPPRPSSTRSAPSPPPSPSSSSRRRSAPSAGSPPAAPA